MTDFYRDAYPAALNARRNLSDLLIALQGWPGVSHLVIPLRESFEQAFTDFLDRPNPATLTKLDQVWRLFAPSLADILAK